MGWGQQRWPVLPCSPEKSMSAFEYQGDRVGTASEDQPGSQHWSSRGEGSEAQHSTFADGTLSDPSISATLKTS